MKCTIKRILDGTENTKEIGADFVDGDFPGYQKLQNILASRI